MPESKRTKDEATVQERKQQKKDRRSQKCKEYTKQWAIDKMQLNLCRACGKAKEDQSQQHCNKCKKRRRSGELRRLYGITLEEYNRMLAAQDGVCWICKGIVTSKKGNLLVDHCHKTGKVRGLLCTKCNAGIGGLGDSIEMLERAIEYLKTFTDIKETER